MIRIGVDFGGTKIEAAALSDSGAFAARVRCDTPPDYPVCIAAVHDLVLEAETQAGATATAIGVGGPGSISPATGMIRGANTTHLNDTDFPGDLARAFGRPVRYANDANCLALSEAVDGAGAGCPVVFAAILGTGCGAGLAVNQHPVEGRNHFAGEWGHNPLPWPTAEEHPGPLCWCGKRGCIELWLSGPAFAREHGQGLTAREAAARPDAAAAIGQYRDRLARALAIVANILDPDVIVLGGGMSNIPEIYTGLSDSIAAHVFSDVFTTPVRPAMHGDSSGVRGAAWLWS